jgi:DNA-binding transcriptional ArsR family regulator
MSSEQDERVAKLEKAVAELTERIAILEQQNEGAATAVPPTQSLSPGEIDFALLDRLYKRDGPLYAADGVKGAIVYAANYQAASGKRAIWYAESAAPELLTYDDQLLTQILVALSHPIRLQLVRLLLKEGETDRQTMQTAVGSQSAGQLYFHLNNLLAAGLVVQLRRGVYEIELGKVSQLLALLATAVDLAKNLPSEGSEA